MSSEPITDSPDPRLQAALAEYLERIDRGEAVDREAFLAEYPDLAAELAPLLETGDALGQMGGTAAQPRSLEVSTHSQLSHNIETVAPGRKGQEATTSGPLPADFGRYRVIKPLGQGAMGVVYLAEDTQLHRKVALKTSSFDDDQSGELLERFYREARSAANLRHPNICPVYDVGEIQGRHYISMAFIEGRTLATYVNASGSLHERQVLVLVRKLALALQDAHQQEIVHRDLKPANIMVDLKGEPIIMDFGLARVGYSEEESRLTQVGMIVGSPAYMSPEQVSGRPELLTGAADQYSLGVILFELLAGQPPFRGSVTAVVGQILTQPPPRLSSLRSDVSPAVEALCLKMLAKSPSDRFASMKQVADEIAALLRGSSAEKGVTAAEKHGSPATSIPKTSLHEALVEEARQRLKQRDYPKAIEMLQQIPEAERPAEAAKLLAQALKLMDEVNFVLQEMEAALQSGDGAKLAKRAQELVKLKPDHPRARQVRELIKKHGPERALQFLAESSAATPTPAPPRRLLIGGLAAGLAVLLAIVWFQFGDSRVKVEILAEGYEVKFNEAEITITDGTGETKVKPGDHTLHIKSLKPGDGGTVEEFDTDKLTLKKGGQAVLTVTRENAEVVAKLDGQVIPRRSLMTSSTGPSVPDQPQIPSGETLATEEKGYVYQTSDELVENSNGVKAGDGRGWKVINGQWNLPDSSENVFADPYFNFNAGNTSWGAIEQLIDVSQFSDAIDNANVEFRLSWKLGCFDNDEGAMTLTALSSDKKELATLYDSGWLNQQPWTNWKLFVASVAPAKGVRFLRLKASSQRSRRPGNQQCSAYFREMSLRAIVKQPFSAPQVSDDGPWISLFNGKDLTGWKTHPSQPGGWAVENGLLVGRSWDTNHLFSESNDFENFHLRAELKTEHQSNGGIYIRCPFSVDRSGKFPSGHEAQILHSHATGPWTGSLKTPGVPVIEQLPHERPVLAGGEWFTIDVIAVGNVFTIKVNGKTTTNIRDGSNLYNKGHIALQAMVDAGVTTPTIIHFKKIEVKRLKMANTVAPKAATVQSPVPNGEIDLLAAVDVSQLGDSDMKWERKGQTVVCNGTGAAGKSAWKGFRLPTEIGGDYEVELDFQQRAFWPMQIDFPLQDTAVRVSLTGDYCDLMIEDDKSQPNAEKTWRSTATKLKTMVPQKLVVRVRQSGTRAEIEATLDGVTLGTYSGERSRIVLPSWVNPNVKQITSGSLCGNLAEGYIELRKAVYRPLAPVSPEIASPPAVSSPHQTTEAATTGSFPQNGRFTAARPLTEINQTEPINAYPSITPDGLSLYWTRETQNVDSTVMQATRKSTDAPFGDIKPVLRHARLASVSPDGLEIVCPFDANGDGKPEELCTSRRATTSQEFPTPQAIPTLAGLHHALGSAFSEDGLRLIVLAAPQPNTTRLIHRVERSGPSAAWGTPRPVTIPNTPAEMDKITWPSLTSGKYLIFSYQDPTNRPVEWGCVADATSDPLAFANPRHMLLDGERFIVRGGRYCPATGELFYTHSGTTPPFEKLEIRVARAEVVPPPSNPDEGWVDLFNGRDLTGWTALGVQGWRVNDGVLIGETQEQQGWLMSNTEYDNFEFDFEYRLAPGTNGGVFLRAWADGPLSGKAFLEVQLLDETDEIHRTMPPSQRTGAIFDILKVGVIPELRPNLWHRMNIAIHEQDIRVTVNGQEVTRGKLPVGKQPHGHLGLQLYPRTKPQRCEFQKLRVRPLRDGLPVAQAAEKMPQDNAPGKANDGQAVALDDRAPQEVQHGLKAEIFEGRNFEKKVAEQIEPNVECFWELGAPAKEAPVDNFSVRFSGWLRAPKTGRYKLFLASKDGARLKVDHKTLIDNWKLKPETAEVSVELTHDPQPIEVEVYNADLYSWVSLLWQPTGTTTACHIPATAFFPDLENARSKVSRSNIDKTGLVADYFDRTFNRKLGSDRVYRIEELWGPYSPRWGLPTNTSAKYTGVLVPPVSGQYKLITAAREHIRVWIDDKPTVESKGIAPQSALVDLEANKPHEIRVEVLTTGHGAHYLHWIPPGTTKELSIPPECLFPNKVAFRQVTSGPVTKVPTEEKPAPSTISAAERETIEKGLAQLKAADEAAGKKLLKAFDEQISKARAAQKISSEERVVRIQGLNDEKSLFDKHGHIPFSLSMRTETLKYLSEFTEARSDAAKVYDRLIESLTKQKRDEAAGRIRTEKEMALAPRVIAIWRLTHLQNKNSVDWKLWSDGSVGEPDRKFLWVLNSETFAIYWTKPVDVRWTEYIVIRPDCLKADVYLENQEHVLIGERVAP